MSNKELIMKVLGDITIRLNNQSIEPINPSKVEREKILVLFTGSDLEIDNVIDNLKILVDSGYLLTLCFSKSAEEILDIQRIKNLLRPYGLYLEGDKENYLSLLRDSHIAIVPVLTQNTLTKVAVGIQDSLISTLLWKLLWSGKKVFVNPNSALYENDRYCENKKMLTLMNSHIEKLGEFGAKVIKDHNYITYIKRDSEILGYQKSKFRKKERVEFKKVITEKDILNLVGASKELVISRDTIITPLAKDVAKENKIKILRK